MKNETASWKELLLLFIVLALGAWLRMWQLGDLGIFFGDAAHDMWQAHQALQDKQLPLLGIASSLPRFHQGPLSVWLLMVIQTLSGPRLTAASYSYAFISLLGLVSMYSLVKRELGSSAALVATSLLTFSPLAVAHARVPFYLAIIPVTVLVYFWTLIKWWEQKPQSWWQVSLAAALTFQFELAQLPLWGLIVWVWWRQKLRPTRSQFLQLIAGGAIGLAPQLLYDFTHRFEQLGMFAAWTVYRLGAFVVPSSEHVVSINKLASVWSSLSLYLPRFWSINEPGLALLFLLFFVSAGVTLTLYRPWPKLTELSVIGTLLLILAFVIHGAPSEAYYPPLLVTVPLLMTSGWKHWNGHLQQAVGLCLVSWAVMVSFQTARHNFFVSNLQPFTYGPSTQEQREIMRYVIAESQGSYRLLTTHPEGVFPAYFDHLRWLGFEQGYRESQDGQPFIVDQNLENSWWYPNSKRSLFTTTQVIQVQ